MARFLALVLVLSGCTGKGGGSTVSESGVPTSAGTQTTPATGTSTTSTTTPTGTASSALTATITDWPIIVETGDMVVVQGEVLSTDPGAITASWSSDLDGSLGPAPIGGSGDVGLATDALSLGWHKIALTADQGANHAEDVVDVGICAWPPLEDFSTGASINGWTLFGNAAWDPGGWLEITGNIQSSDGAIYKTDEKVNAGDVAIEFDIATGGGINGGADGFSVNVIDAYDEFELASIVNAASNGGCLGYGTGGACGNLTINAFHIEFDTWDNPDLGDPTPGNHVAIALNGDPQPMLWASLPSLEDLVWRHVRVEIAGSDVTVSVDGSVVTQGTLPGFTFDGGYIGVSGSTGWATNYHRFDNLQLYDLCAVPTGTTTP